MNKKYSAKGKLKIVKIMILTVIMIIFAIICVRKIDRIQNEKHIIGTWKNASSEEVFTFQDNGKLAVTKDMPASGLSCGDASYYFAYSDTICITQGDASVEFEIEADQNRLTIFFMGQEYLDLEKQ